MITLNPIGIAYNERSEVEDDHWGSIVSKIVLDHSLSEESLNEIESFSHLEIIFYFHKVNKGKIVTGARYPRNNRTFPKVGIFSQRGKNRPNQLGVTIVKLIKKEGKQLFVTGLDCINETPILDIKPVMREFLPKEPVVQPKWTEDVMKDYWD